MRSDWGRAVCCIGPTSWGSTRRRTRSGRRSLTFRSAEGSVGGNAGLPIAIEARFLCDKAVFTFEAKGQRFTVVTSPGGANRVYRVSVDFPAQRTAAAIVDAQGRSWQVTEDALIAAHDSAQRFPRVPARRAFWFGWYAQHPETMLITR